MLNHDGEAAAATAVAAGVVDRKQVSHRRTPQGRPPEKEIWIMAQYLDRKGFVISIEPAHADPDKEAR
jgi:hypothetical protein